MAIRDLFFKRQARLRGESPDVYTYDDIPERLRVQVVQIMIDRLGNINEYENHYYGENIQAAYQSVVLPMRKELGAFELPHPTRQRRRTLIEELADYMLAEMDAEKWLSAVELLCTVILSETTRYAYKGDHNASENALAAIDEINGRFKEHGVGYEFDERIIRIDTEYVHVEAVKPALTVLRDKRYQGAEQEFRSAHEHYRAGRIKEALTDALKSLESTMKVICTKRHWAFQPTDTAKKLIAVCFSNGLIPTYWQTHFTSLQQMLESSVPTARNKDSGHGQGVDIKTVPDHLAAYVLHMTASTIVFLVEAERAL